MCGGGIEPRLSDIAGRSSARPPVIVAQTQFLPRVVSVGKSMHKMPVKGRSRVLQNGKSIITLRWSHVSVHGDSLVLTVMQRASRSVGLGEGEGGRKVLGRKRPASSLPSLPLALIVRLCLRLPVPEEREGAWHEHCREHRARRLIPRCFCYTAH